MNRVLAARSLKFSEHRNSDRSKQEGKSDVVVQKKDSAAKGGKGDTLRSTFTTSSSNNNEKLVTPSVVAAIVQREAHRKKMEPRGVWSPLGISYQTHGHPDLALGEEANINDLKKNKKARRIARDSREARRKLEKLIELFRATKSSLKAVNLFNRGAPKDTAKPAGIFPPVGDDGPASGKSTPRAGADGEERKKEKKEPTTLEKIAALGKDNQERKNKGKKQEQETKARMMHHLTEDVGSHLTRWRDSFEETKSAQDRALIQQLISRSEDKDSVYENFATLNHAVSIVENSLGQKGYKGFGNKDNTSLWKKAQIQAMHARNSDSPQRKLEYTQSSGFGHEGEPGRVRPSKSREGGHRKSFMAHSASVPTLHSNRSNPKIAGPRGSVAAAARGQKQQLLKLPAAPM
mmetsp:Transcript_2533/g.4753  ORF Transcript_2533/g.4753 Transcript_2533/m.4753 type:complete len:405 (+) Transcript_2533:76-1290(+)|eukprot:CAMPEP_0175155820 /NCGR_PEP_ID=MMETSP0087-20121206/21219_1 /TAXON_ID=136419 /ORGANISM="Unknown Unknown, Strain D1" /LENGTH=404 /DNA_ID=CAMNT_0016443081 /DNA_START=76 /DNA_END=1290 /DNA_ORIENTATION=+